MQTLNRNLSVGKKSSGTSKWRKKSGSGFTILELLIVVAIIAVVVAILLANISNYITKGKVAAEKGDLHTIQSNSGGWFSSSPHGLNVGYLGFPADSSYTLPNNAATIAGATASVINVTPITGAAYCAEITLSDGTFWCVDSSGYVGAALASNTCSSGNIACH